MAGGGIPLILWGTNFENVLQFGYPIDSPVTGRKPRDGSEFGQSASGIEDAWITGYDYELSADFRWIPDDQQTDPVASPWGGQTGVQAFLDWARQKNTFRYVPDKTVPDFYVDGCYLVEPLDSHGTLESDATRNLHLLIRNPSFDFALALRGIMFEYAPGASLTDPIVGTSTRAGTAWQLGKSGVYAAAATDVLRDRDYEAGVRGTRYDRAATNLIENGDYESDAVGSLANVSTVVRSTAFARSGAASLKVTTQNSSSSGAFIHNRAGTRIAATVGLDYVLSGWIYVPAASVGKTIKVRIEWWSSAPAFLSASEVTGIALVAGWQRVSATGLAPASTATADCFIGGDTAQGVWDFYIDVAQFETGKRPTSAIPTNTAAVTRPTDSGTTWPFAWPAQALLVLVDYTDFGIGAGAGGGVSVIAQLGNVFQAGWFLVDVGAGGLVVFHEPLGQAKSMAIAAVPAYKDRVRVLGLLYPDGSVQGVRSINGAADVSSGRSAATADPIFTAWNPQTVYVARPANFDGFALHSIKVAALTFGGITRDTITKALLA